ncbi:MAG: hypothetical protein AAF518_19415 [Spirochaetota bacterium]
MKPLKLNAYLALFLREVTSYDWETISNDPEMDFELEYSFYLSHMKTSFKSLDDAYFNREDLNSPLPKSWQSRFYRLQAIASRMYFVSLHCTSEPLHKIIDFCKKEGHQRLIVFQSKDAISDYTELLEIFHRNSFLYQRYSKPRTLAAKYTTGGFLNKKKLQRLLQGKGNGVYEETFELLKPVLDKDIRDNVEILYPKTDFLEA